MALSFPSLAMSDNPLDTASYTKRFKVTVEIETPEGVKTGSAVREISNSAPVINLPDVGNPANIRGEAVVIDLEERGVVFALISHKADNEFKNAFPIPNEKRQTTEEAMSYYNDLPIGATGTLNPDGFPGYPTFVYFADANDPLSVRLVKGKVFNVEKQEEVPVDNFEEIFGSGVSLKAINFEIVDESLSHKVDQYLPTNFNKIIVDGWGELPRSKRAKIVDLVTFKKGEI